MLLKMNVTKNSSKFAEFSWYGKYVNNNIGAK